MLPHKILPTINPKSILKILGPGILYAGAAVGVSHLVQSTRAGAGFGYIMIIAVVFAHILKYPFFEFGPRYAAATGTSLLDGYKKLGNWAVILFIIMTIGTMFTIQAAVTVVTAGLAEELTGIVLKPWQWSAILLSICLCILGIGKYSLLDKTMKVIIVILTLTTIVALFAAFGSSVERSPENMIAFDWSNTIHMTFLIALLGWMPAPIDISVWHSIWTLAKKKDTGYTASLKESLLDFKIGYWGTAILAICFVSLGAIVIYGTGTELAGSGGGFSRQLIGLYTSSLGKGAYWLIGIAAFTTMFSTTLTCLDAFPRVLRRTSQIIFYKSEEREERPLYWFWILLTAGGALVILAFLIDNMKTMVDVATILSFLTAPVLAIMNYLVVTGKSMPEQMKPGKVLIGLSWAGMIFLLAFSLYFLILKFSTLLST